MRLIRIDLQIGLILMTLLLLNLQLILLTHGRVIDHPIVKVHLRPRLANLSHRRRIKIGETGLIINIDPHFAEHFHEFLEFVVFLSQSTDEFVGFAFVDDGFVLDFLGLIGVAQG
jgi:hypothetical protein